MYFIMMCINLSADASPFSSDTINQIKNAVKVVGNFEIFRVFERNMMIVMRKSQMNPSMHFDEIYSIVRRITGIPYNTVWKGPISLETVEDTCKDILDISERCCCFKPACCKHCISQNPQNCSEAHLLGGVLCEFVVRNFKSLILLPDWLSIRQASILEPVADILSALEKVTIDFSSDILIIGSGFLGLITIHILYMMGVKRIVAVEPLEERRKLAIEHGACRI